MAIEHLLRDLIKPELNGIYTEPPSALRGGGDMGLFCREHAFHCLALCGMLRLRAEIVRGDFTAILDEKTGVTSFGDHSDHAWCQIEDVCPVDLSANFDFYGTGLPSLDLVHGVGRRGPYLISYTDDTELYQRRMDDRGHLLRLSYLERETVRIPLDDMLIYPHVLLTKPPRGGLEEIFGKGVSTASTSTCTTWRWGGRNASRPTRTRSPLFGRLLLDTETPRNGFGSSCPMEVADARGDRFTV